MSFIDRNLKQLITIFSVSSKDVFGNPVYTVSSARGRWEDTQVKFVDKQGNETVSSSIVYIDKDVSVGDYLFLGYTSALKPPVGAREIKSFDKIPDINFKKYLRKAILK